MTPCFRVMVVLATLLVAAPGAVAGDEKGPDVEEALRRLISPKSAAAAANDIVSLHDPAAEPGLVRALDHEKPSVRAAAARAIGHQPEPTDETLDRLARLLAEDGESDPRREAAVALSRIGAARSRDALERCIRSDRDRQVRLAAMPGLGAVGNRNSMGVLLKAWDEEPARVAEALSRIANQRVPGDLPSRIDAAKWWMKNIRQSQEEWCGFGFAAAGVEFSEPFRWKSIPRLLDLAGHEHFWVRTNAVRVLRDVSGRRLPWMAIGANDESPAAVAARAKEIAEWRSWWNDHPANLSEWMLGFHRSPAPDRLAWAIHEMCDSGLMKKSGAMSMAFLAEVFRQHPDRVEVWSRETLDLGETDRHWVWMAVWWSDVPEAASLLKRAAARETGELARALHGFVKGRAPSLLEIPIARAEYLDMLWVSWFASGNAKYLERLATALVPPDPDEKNAMKVVIRGAAQWSAISNARQHADVYEVFRALHERSTGALKEELGTVLEKARPEKDGD